MKAIVSARNRALQCGSVSGTEITLSRCRGCRMLSGALQCGSVSGTEITCVDPSGDVVGLAQLQCGSVSGTEITDPVGGVPLDDTPAAMRLRLRDGDHVGGGPTPEITTRKELQCGSVSGTEITSEPDGIGWLNNSCNAAPSQGRRSLDAAAAALTATTGCNAAPSQGRRSRCS